MKKLFGKVVALAFIVMCVVSMFSVSATAASKTTLKKTLTGKKWSNKVQDPVMEYSTKYTFTFKKNGTVVLKGWRNKDCGTYKITGKKTAKLTFKKLYVDAPGEGWSRLDGGSYTATIKLDKKNRIKVKFKNATETNAVDGYYYSRR